MTFLRRELSSDYDAQMTTEPQRVRILITGSRQWTDRKRLNAALDGIYVLPGGTLTIVHGDNPDGADKMASDWCQQGHLFERFTVVEEPHPANWTKYAKRAGPIRNGEMVHLGADLCFAFLTPGCKGTIGCAAIAQDANIPVRPFFALR